MSRTDPNVVPSFFNQNFLPLFNETLPYIMQLKVDVLPNSPEETKLVRVLEGIHEGVLLVYNVTLTYNKVHKTSLFAEFAEQANAVRDRFANVSLSQLGVNVERVE